MRIAIFNPKTHRIVPIEPTLNMRNAAALVDDDYNLIPCIVASVKAAPEYPTAALDDLIPHQAG